MLVKCMCGTSISIESRHLGNKIICPQCKRQLRVASGNSDPGTAAASDSRVTPIISDSNPLPKTQPPKINTRSDDLPMRLRAPEAIERKSTGYYRPTAKRKSNETFKFLTVCAVFLVGLCILGGFGLVGLAIYKQNHTGNTAVADADNADPNLEASTDPQPPEQNNFSSVPPVNPSGSSRAKPADNNRSPSSNAPPGVRVHGTGSRRGTTSQPSHNSTSPSIANRNTGSDGTSGAAPSSRNQGSQSSTASKAKSSETIINGNGESFELDPEATVARSFSTGGTSIMGIQISPDKKYLGANSLDGIVYVFDLKEGGRLLYKIVSKEKLIRAISFSDATSLYTLGDQESSEENCIAIRNPEDGKRTAISIGETGTNRANCLAVSNDGRSIFAHWQRPNEFSSSTVFQDSKFWRFSAIGDEVKVFDLEKVFRDATTFRSKTPSCSVFTPDGRMLLSGFEDGWIGASSGAGAAIDIVGSKLLHNGPVVDIAISPDGTKMASGSEDGALQLTSLKSSSWSSKTLNRESTAGDVLGVAFSSDNKWVAASMANRTIEIYGVETRKLAKTLRTSSLCTDLEFMGKGQFLVAGGKDGKIRILPVGL